MMIQNLSYFLAIVASMATSAMACPSGYTQFGSSCYCTGRRKLMKTDDLKALEGPCGKEKYDFSLFVDSHLCLLVAPGEDVPASCQTSWVLQDNLGQKVTQTLETMVEDAEAKFENPLPLGEIELTNIVEAFEDAETMEEDWDVVTNNCATFVLSVLKGLDIQPEEDDYVAEYVVKSLTSSGGNVVDSIKASPRVEEILVEGVAMEEHDNKTLIHNLVNNYIKNH
jgi:hypothetical protein